MKCCAIGVCLDKARQVWSGLSKKEVAEKVIRICYETDVDLGYRTTKPSEAECLQGYGRIAPLAAYKKVTDGEEPRFGNLEVFVTQKVDSAPVEEATVFLKEMDLYESTDKQGRAFFAQLKPREYTVSAGKQGYITQTKTVTVEAGVTTTLRFALQKEEQQVPPKLKITIEGATRILIDEDADKEYEAKRKVEVLPVDASFLSLRESDCD